VLGGWFIQGVDFKDLKTELLEDLEAKKHYDSLKPRYTLIAALIARRNELNLSQRDLAGLTGLKQPAICRLESGSGDVTLDTLSKVSRALGLEISLTEIPAL
jgi:DNA-binding XRE family transcriptional regulator